MLTSLLSLEGFHDFQKIKFLQQVLDNYLALTCRSYEVSILNNFHKNLTSHKSLIEHVKWSYRYAKHNQYKYCQAKNFL
jgi:hypothetical protein